MRLNIQAPAPPMKVGRGHIQIYWSIFAQKQTEKKYSAALIIANYATYTFPSVLRPLTRDFNIFGLNQYIYWPQYMIIGGHIQNKEETKSDKKKMKPSLHLW